MEKNVKSVLELYFSAAQSHPDKKAFYFGKPEYKDWLSYLQIWNLAFEYHQILKESGVQRHDSVGVWARSSWRWEISQLAVLMCGATVVGMDLNEPTTNYQKIEDTVDLKFILFEDDYLIERWNQSRHSNVVFIRMSDRLNSPSLEMGKISLPEDTEREIFVFFTSGTTSSPKAIAYNDAKLIFAIRNLAQLYPEVSENPRTVCWLPLANLFQRILNFSAIANKGEIFFVENPVDALGSLATISPDIFISVPRFYEKIYDTIFAKFESAIFPINHFLKLGVKILRLKWQFRKNIFISLFLAILITPWKLFVFNRLSRLFGNNLKVLISGSAPLKKEIIVFFHSLGLPIYEAYGTTENILPIAANTSQSFRIGSVGRPLLSDSVKLSEDGEVLVKGPGVFSGYKKSLSPDKFENDFYKTGDLGYMDDDGFLFLLGRKTEMFKTATGKKVAPSEIESCFKTLSFIDQVVVLGEGRKLPFVILTLDFYSLSVFLKKKLERLFDLETGKFIPSDIIKIETAIAETLKKSHLAVKPAAALLLTRKFSLESQEVTPNLKIKRSFLEKKFKTSIEKIYSRIDLNEEFPIQLVDSYDNEVFSELIVSPYQRSFKVLTMLLRLFFQRFRFIFKLQSKEAHYRLVGSFLKDGLGGLKGPFHKLGQMLSLMPENIPSEVSVELGMLFKNSQAINSNLIRALVEKELKKPIPAVFLEWSDQPIATGSIGQVHWARLLDGQEVAVKVLIPQIGEILNSDLKLLRLALPFLKLVLNFESLDAHYEELKNLMLDEVDLRKEAAYFKVFKHIFKDSADILIPNVYTAISTEKMLVTEYFNGQSFDDFATYASPQEKSRAAELIWYTCSYPINVFAIFNADPHPGNYLIMRTNIQDEVRLQIVMVDFGFCKKWEKSFIEKWKQQILACCRSDRQRFAELSLDLGIQIKDSPQFFDQLFDINHQVIYRPWLKSEKFHFTEEWLKFYLQAMVKYQILVPGLVLPKQFMALSRLYWGNFSLMSKLNVEINYHELTMPYIEAKTKDLPLEMNVLEGSHE